VRTPLYTIMHLLIEEFRFSHKVKYTNITSQSQSPGFLGLESESEAGVLNFLTLESEPPKK